MDTRDSSSRDDDGELLDEYGLGGAEPGAPGEAPRSAVTDAATVDVSGAPQPPGGYAGSSDGGVNGADGKSAYDLLGDLGDALGKSPQFQQLLQQRLANRRPVLKKQPLNRHRDYDISLGPIEGKAGETKTVSVSPQCYFRVEKVMATDTAPNPGTGTEITQILVGNRLQRPAGSPGTLTAFFANNSLGSGVKFDTCQPALSISVSVHFLVDCKWYGSLFGKAAL